MGWIAMVGFVISCYTTLGNTAKPKWWFNAGTNMMKQCDSTISSFLDAMASPSTYPCQWVSQWVSGSVIDSFRLGDSYRISELCELVFSWGTWRLSTEIMRLSTSALRECFNNLSTTPLRVQADSNTPWQLKNFKVDSLPLHLHHPVPGLTERGRKRVCGVICFGTQTPWHALLTFTDSHKKRWLHRKGKVTKEENCGTWLKTGKAVINFLVISEMKKIPYDMLLEVQKWSPFLQRCPILIRPSNVYLGKGVRKTICT